MEFDAACRARHARYFLNCLDQIPSPYASLDTNRLTLAYFCVSGLDVIGELHRADAERIIRWVYSLQVLEVEGTSAADAEPTAVADVGASASGAPLSAGRRGGFRGGSYLGSRASADGAPSNSEYDGAHLAMTYTALAVLLILGDDLSRVRRLQTLAFVRSMQDKRGSFSACESGESDLRFLFCAAATCTMLRDTGWRGMDVEAATAYVVAAQSYDGGIGLSAGQEAHGGSTYTALASLSLMGTLQRLRRPQAAVQWCVERQLGGFQGRPNKDEDTCYSFWIGASLELLGAPQLSEPSSVGAFAQRCECLAVGGFSKHPGAYPDVLHSYFAICGLSLVRRHKALLPIDPRLGITRRAARAAGLLAGAAEAADGCCVLCDE